MLEFLIDWVCMILCALLTAYIFYEAGLFLLENFGWSVPKLK